MNTASLIPNVKHARSFNNSFLYFSYFRTPPDTFVKSLINVINAAPAA